MSLQPQQPSLLPEKLTKPSTATTDALTAPEKSYFERRWEYAKKETREHKKVELMAGSIGACITALVVGSRAGDVAAGVAAAVLTAIFALIAIFLYHLLRAPSALDAQLRRELEKEKQTALELETKVQSLNTHTVELTDTLRKKGAEIETVAMSRDFRNQEIAALETERDSLKAQLEELNEPKLTFEINQSLEGKFFAIHDTSTFAPSGIHPVTRNRYIIKVFLKARFVNKHPDPILAEKMTLSLHETTVDGEEREITSERSRNVKATIQHMVVNWETGLLVPGTYRSHYYDMSDDLIVSGKDGARLNERCFLRLTMYAMNQRSYIADIYIDWDEARQSTGTFLLPKTLVRYSSS